MKNQQRTAVLVVAALFGLGLGSCVGADTDGGEANVQVRVQGLGSEVDDVVDVMLYADIGGTLYFFEVLGSAGFSDATFLLNVYEGDDATAPLVYSVDFTLPNEDVDAQPGDTGYGSVGATIYDGSLNTVVIVFDWSAYPPPLGDARIDMQFSHRARIVTWSTAPGPAGVSGGDVVDVQAAVEFFGDGLSESVTAQFWDNELAGGSLVGTAGTLTLTDAVNGIWNGSVEAVAGADRLRLTASDSEGSTYHEMPFLVP